MASWYVDSWASTETKEGRLYMGVRNAFSNYFDSCLLCWKVISLIKLVG